jgi:PPK2 family polyphosphate:nucleotide phosphotransferase
MDAKTSKLVKRYRVTKGAKFRLRDIDPRETRGFDNDAGKKAVEDGLERLTDLQEKLYADNRWALLLILQGMDASGKDSLIAHVMAGVNPQGCQVTSFAEPSSEELDHTFFWRTSMRLPARGNIGIFNRSYYEEVLVVRVHDELLRKQRLPGELITRDIWRERFDDINNFERHLSRNGTVVLKFFLHISPEEQQERFLKRIDNPRKNWKFALSDVRDRQHWNEYMDAYEDMIRHTATKHAPWFVVPADNKWFTRMVVAAAVADALQKLKPQFPKLSADERKQLAGARAALLKKNP